MTMKVLVACERFGIVRDAFIAHGHDAWSCDLEPTQTPGPHIQDDALTVSRMPGWDLMVAHPDCTYLTVANTYMKRGCSKYTPEQATQLREDAVRFFMELWNAPVERVAIENPVGVMSTRFRKPDQIVHPWQFGDDASKSTCLWLRGLPPLVHTNPLPGGRKARRANQTPSGQNRLGPSPERAMLRAKTYPGIAHAMAQQWGSTWTPVVFASECDEDGNCPNCGIDYAECHCPGPTQDPRRTHAGRTPLPRRRPGNAVGHG